VFFACLRSVHEGPADHGEMLNSCVSCLFKWPSHRLQSICVSMACFSFAKTTQWQQTEFARLSVAKPFLKWSMNRLRSKYSKYEKWSSACLEEELHVSFETQDANSTGGHRRTLAARMAYTLRKIHNGLKMSPKTSHDQKWPLGKDPKKWGFCKVVITGEAMLVDVTVIFVSMSAPANLTRAF